METSDFSPFWLDMSKLQSDGVGFETVVPELIVVGQDCCRRGWALGTSGNFSVLLWIPGARCNY